MAEVVHLESDFHPTISSTFRRRPQTAGRRFFAETDSNLVEPRLNRLLFHKFTALLARLSVRRSSHVEVDRLATLLSPVELDDVPGDLSAVVLRLGQSGQLGLVGGEYRQMGRVGLEGVGLARTADLLLECLHVTLEQGLNSFVILSRS